jgi:hypothetical protein
MWHEKENGQKLLKEKVYNSHKQMAGDLSLHANHTTELDLEDMNLGVIISSLSQNSRVLGRKSISSMGAGDGRKIFY